MRAWRHRQGNRRFAASPSTPLFERHGHFCWAGASTWSTGDGVNVALRTGSLHFVESPGVSRSLCSWMGGPMPACPEERYRLRRAGK